MHLIRLASAAALLLACWLVSASVAAQIAPRAPASAASAATTAASAAASASTSASTSASASAPAPAASAASSASAPAASVAASTALQRTPSLPAAPRGDAARRLPIVLLSKSFSTLPDLWMLAEGEVEFRRGSLVVRADRLAYDVPTDRANARGAVRIEQPGVVYSGPELDLSVQRFEGSFRSPRFEFTKLKSGGSASRVDFLGANRASAINASYTSCPREDSDSAPEPAWVLKADRVDLNLESNVGVAEGAVLRFLGKPIIALPTLSFPLGDTRKSGWLPPTLNLDNRSGVDLSVPYYWDIAPNRDATLAPRLITRRGLGLDAEFRYLEPSYEGQLRLDLLPHDRLAGRSRGAMRWTQEGRLPWGIQARADVARVSDDEWWRDFPNRSLSLTTRLLAQRLSLERPFDFAPGFAPQPSTALAGSSVNSADTTSSSPGLTPTGSQGLAYARVLRWQALQATDAAVVSPYERNPQLGLRWRGSRAGWLLGMEAEYNRFTLPSDPLARAGRDSGGERLHAQAQVSYPWREPGWWVTPKITVNGAAYASNSTAAGAVARASRTLPTFSLDTGLELERYTEAFGRALRQTLEPRLLYVNTPFRAQSQLPNYDAAAKDFNFVSIYSENTFSGVDRISDTHQISAGFTTRLVDEASGAEALRLGLVQRYQLRSQFVAPQADGSPDGPALTQRLSDLLLLGSTSVLPHWNFDAAVQYSPDLQRSVRSIVGVRHSPGPFRTVNATYRLARGLSEQVELGWQWPLLERTLKANGVGSGADGCQGSWYSVGRINYSLKDSRVTDSILGFEYDAGCWIGRVVAERLSTGRSAATTRLLIQLELVGLSRIGSNPLKVLKENIPGYRLLREDRSEDRLNDSP
jgi:LPS-assembly protein